MDAGNQPRLTAHRLLIERSEQNNRVLSRNDLLDCGLSPQSIHRWTKSGRLTEVYPRAYVLAGSPLIWEQRLLCALTWAGPGALVSHRSAAALLKLDGYSEQLIEVTSPRRKKVPDGVIVHNRSPISPHDGMKRGHLTLTTPARTILDLGAVSPLETVEYALEDMLRRRLTTLAAIRWELRTQGGQGCAGSATLRKLLEMRPDGYVPTGSPFEVDIDRLLRSATFPPYTRQFQVPTKLGDRWPDFAFPDYTFAIEGKSWRHHSGRQPWDNDNQRDEALRAEGWDILYATWEDIHDRPTEFIQTVYRRLQLRGWADARLFLD